MRISDWSSDVCSSDLAASRQELIVARVVDRVGLVRFARALIYRMSGKAPGHRFQAALASIVATDEAGAAFPDFAGAGVGLLLSPRLHRSANLNNGRFVGAEVAHRGLRVLPHRQHGRAACRD